MLNNTELNFNPKLLERLILFFLLSITIIYLSPDLSYADLGNSATPSNNTDTTMITNVLCAAINQLTGPVGKTISILVLITVAIAAFFGKVSWGLFITVMIAMGGLVGAGQIANIMFSAAGSSGSPCS